MPCMQGQLGWRDVCCLINRPPPLDDYDDDRFVIQMMLMPISKKYCKKEEVNRQTGWMKENKKNTLGGRVFGEKIKKEGVRYERTE